MKSHLELSVQRDIDRIKAKVSEMSRLADQALKDCLKILSENNRQLAYAVILRDQNINAKEKEVDRLCLEFLVRQQPVALPLRFAYSTIKVNLEIERVGDYAESIARQLLRINDTMNFKLKDGVMELGKLASGMFHDATNAFVNQNPELARKSIDIEKTVDALRTELNSQLKAMYYDNNISFELLDTMMAIVRRFERVSDQARNICMEVLYMCTGEYAKHPGSEFFRVLFVDYHNSCSSQMAEAISQDLKQQKFIFSSAGVDPVPINRTTIDFMKSKGFDLSRTAPKAIHQIPNLDHYQIIIVLDEEAKKAFPNSSPKIVFLDWPVNDPSKIHETAEEQALCYEKTYRFLKDQIHDLVEAIIGTENK
jgi:phosphate transport system protein